MVYGCLVIAADRKRRFYDGTIKKTYGDWRLQKIIQEYYTITDEWRRFDKIAMTIDDGEVDKKKGNDQEQIQSNSTSCPKHQMGKGHVQLRRH